MRTHIHDIEMFVPLLKGAITRVEDYTGRALLAPGGVVVYENPQVKPYVEYLNDMNLGPEKVWEVEKKGETLFHSLDQSPKKEEVLEQSDMIVPFVSWDKTNQFKKEWNLDDNEWGVQPERVHHDLENKINIRSKFPSEWFVDYEVCEILESIQQNAEKFLEKYGGVIVRHPKMASGIGSRLITEKEFLYSDEFKEFVDSHSDKNMLVEEFVDTEDEYSIIWEVDEDGQIDLLCWTKQYIKNRQHQGNLITDPEKILDSSLVEDIEESTFEIVDKYRYPGRVGFDLILENSGDWKILESNCRYGGSSYPNFIREQVGDDRCVIMHNLHPELESFQEVHEVFEQLEVDYDSDSRTGAFVANPFCLPDKCAAIIVGETIEQAEGILDKILSKLG